MHVIKGTGADVEESMDTARFVAPVLCCVGLAWPDSAGLARPENAGTMPMAPLSIPQRDSC